MKWFVYPDRGLDEIRRFRDPFGVTYLELLPASMSFLGRLIEQLQTTPNPAEAEFLLIPALVNFLSAANHCDPGPLCCFLHSYSWFSRAPERHAIFLLGDNSAVPEVCRNSAVFMPSCSRLASSLPMFYFGEDPGPSVAPIERAEVDVSFQGTVATGGGLRERVVDALRNGRSRSISLHLTGRYFHGIADPSERAALRAQFLAGMARSRFVFCPRGDGLSSLRFFETLALGRLPILVADETSLPLERYLPYDQFMVRVPESRVEDWEWYVDAFLLIHPDLSYCSSTARNVYRLWFTDRALGRFVELSLAER